MPKLVFTDDHQYDRTISTWTCADDPHNTAAFREEAARRNSILHEQELEHLGRWTVRLKLPWDFEY